MTKYFQLFFKKSIMAKPTNKSEFAEYCLRKLGKPLIRINVSDSQVDDRIDEALSFWSDYHSDASLRTYVKHELTQGDLDTNTIPVPQEVQFISRVLKINGLSTSSGIAGSASQLLFNVQFQLVQSDIWTLMGGGMSQYVAAMQNIALLDDTFNTYPTYAFSRHNNKLVFNPELKDRASVGQFIVYEAHVNLKPEDNPDIWGDRLLQKLATAYIKKQWGSNLGKWKNISMPGGITYNGGELFAEALEEIEHLEETFQDKYEKPPLWQIG